MLVCSGGGGSWGVLYLGFSVVCHNYFHIDSNYFMEQFHGNILHEMLCTSYALVVKNVYPFRLSISIGHVF